LANQVKKILNALHGHPFFCKTCSYKKRKTSLSDLSIGCSAQLAYQAVPKTVGRKIIFVFRLSLFKVIKIPQDGAL
jgi:hypothetical protein